MFLVKVLLLLGFSAMLQAAPTPQTGITASSSGFWMANIQRQGSVAFGNSSTYQVFRNVRDFGAKGDGSTDDTDAINSAISSGDRCGLGCDSSTTTPAIVYFPPGTYVVSKPIILYYYTQLIGDAGDLPVIKAAAAFTGMAVIDSDPYTDTGDNWYTNQNNFFRQVRNFVIDLTSMPQNVGAGIHWQVGQATSLQNIRFEMIKGGGDANKQQGIFMDNGSGGFMSDLTFNGGNYGMFLGNQQFTTRNLTFNGCNTAIFMNWNWAWTFKSVTVNDCAVALNMSNRPSNQTVGSVMMLDSTLSTTDQAIVTAWAHDSVPPGAGTLILDNVDFRGSSIAIAGIDGETILPGGSVIQSWVQGNTYTSGSTPRKRDLQSTNIEDDTCPAPEIVTVTVYQTLGNGASHSTSTPIASAASGTSVASRLSSAHSDSASGSGAVAAASSKSATSATGGASTGKASQTVPTRTPASGTSIPDSGSSLRTAGSTGKSHSPVPPGSTCPAPSPTKSRVQETRAPVSKPAALVDGSGKVFERSKPQYETVPASSFVSVKSAGAKGDGMTDDTVAIQRVLDSVTSDQIVYFDHGAYIITSTIKVPKDIKIVGEIWPLLMASGAAFSDENNPIPMLQIGEPGDFGSVEIQDLILETKGPAPGAILMEWNVAGSSQGSVAMWDVHFRVGGSAGTELQSNTCTKNPTSEHGASDACIGAFMLFHATQSASAYVENCWFWVADHELDLPDHNQIDIYNGRGVLLESQNAVWMYATAAEHSQLYQYQLSDAKNVFMALIQTETPYWQSNPGALKPFKPQTSFNDPDFSICTTESCRKAWGLRVFSSSDILIYGGGLYSFFENYDQTCLATESCQENIVQVDCSRISIFGLSTKASTNMITSSDGTPLALQEDNTSSFTSALALFEQ